MTIILHIIVSICVYVISNTYIAPGLATHHGKVLKNTKNRQNLRFSLLFACGGAKPIKFEPENVALRELIINSRHNSDLDFTHAFFNIFDIFFLTIEIPINLILMKNGLD